MTTLRTFRPTLDTLETRDCPTVTTTVMPGNILDIRIDNVGAVGTHAQDVRVYDYYGLAVVNDNYVLTGVGQKMATADVGGIVVRGSNLRNFINLDGVRRTSFIRLNNVIQVYAGGNHDVVWGSEYRDSIDGGAGNDDLWGGWGEDTILGGHGQDTLRGSAGHDSLEGGDHKDILYGDEYGGDGANDGNDRMFGGAGDDFLSGNNGHDSMNGGAGNDTLWGWSGNDTMTGGAGTDEFWGGAGTRDWVTDYAGSDYLWGNDSTNIEFGIPGKKKRP